MVQYFTFFLLVLFGSLNILAELSPAMAQIEVERESISLKKSYQQAKFYYNELHSNPSLSQDRANWLNGARNFRKIYLSGPKSDYAAPSLYMLGRLYAATYERFHKEVDLQESLSYYHDVSELFSDNSLADDALFALGNLYLNTRKNPKKAAINFGRIIASYRQGDMYNRASNKLKELSKEFDIPLPQSMLRQSYLGTLTNVLPVKYWSSDNYTRVVIKASGPVRYQERLLEKRGTKPRRLYLDFQQSYIDPKYRSPIPIEDGLLKRIRTGQFSPEVVRVVLDIESISDYKIFSLPDPFRVVIDVRGESRPSHAVVPKTKSLPRPPVRITAQTRIRAHPQDPKSMTLLEDFKKIPVAGGQQDNVPQDLEEIEDPIAGDKLSLAQQLGLGVRKIVIDPGHGGKDPGASAFGLNEKDIVLKIARKLRPILAKETGAEVILTRDQDIFIPLEERTAIANTHEADLFISLHINAHPSPKVHGLETYYLNLSTNAEAMRVAAFENATSTHQMSDLQDILIDIMKNSKINESSRLAGFVHKALSAGIKDVQKTQFKNLGVKQAPFYVLIGAEMPAILVEMAFITNQQDSGNLGTDSFLDIIAKDIVVGVQDYIHSTTASL